MCLKRKSVNNEPNLSTDPHSRIILGSIFFVGYQIGKGQTVIVHDTNQGIEIQQKANSLKLQRNLENTIPLSRDHQRGMPILKKNVWAKSLTKREVRPSPKQEGMKQDRNPEMNHRKPHQGRPGKHR